jgi:hypothetical protein
MMRVKKGSTVLAVAVGTVLVGFLLFMGIKSANRETGQTVANTTPIVATVSPTGPSGGSLETDLNSVDSKMSGIDTYQANIDKAINDKPVDTGL